MTMRGDVAEVAAHGRRVIRIGLLGQGAEPLVQLTGFDRVGRPANPVTGVDDALVGPGEVVGGDPAEEGVPGSASRKPMPPIARSLPNTPRR